MYGSAAAPVFADIVAEGFDLLRESSDGNAGLFLASAMLAPLGAHKTASGWLAMAPQIVFMGFDQLKLEPDAVVDAYVEKLMAFHLPRTTDWMDVAGSKLRAAISAMTVAHLLDEVAKARKQCQVTDAKSAGARSFRARCLDRIEAVLRSKPRDAAEVQAAIPIMRVAVEATRLFDQA